jgi:hypothetical protein
MARHLRDVPDEVLAQCLLAQLGVPGLKAIRLSCKRFKALGAAAVRTLLAQGGRLDARALVAFPAASGVLIKLTSTDDLSGLRQRLTSLASQLPGSLQRLTIQWPDAAPGDVPTASAQAATAAISALLQQLPQLPPLQGMQDLEVAGVVVTAAAAGAALRGLPNLQRVVLGTAPQASRHAAHVTISRFPPALRRLNVSAPHQGTIIDAEGLAACPPLRDLRLRLHNPSCLRHPHAIGGCTALEQLALWVWHVERSTAPQLAALDETILSAASQLPRLCALDMPHLGVVAGSPQWARLAAMPRLGRLVLSYVQVPAATAAGEPAAAAAAGVTCLEAGDVLLAEGSAPGALAQLLPGLQRLQLTSTVTGQGLLAQALQGHGALQELELEATSEPEPLPPPRYQWPAAGPLSSMPQLRRVVLVGDAGCEDWDVLLRDAAGCARLQQLLVAPDWAWRHVDTELKGSGEEPAQPPAQGWMTRAGLEALAAGACSGSLRQLSLEHSARPIWVDGARQLPAFSPADVARLLGGALPSLQALVVDLRLAAGSGWRQPAAAADDDDADAAADVVEADLEDKEFERLVAAEMYDGWIGVPEHGARNLLKILGGEVPERLECEEEIDGRTPAARARWVVLGRLQAQLAAHGMRGVGALRVVGGFVYTVVEGRLRGQGGQGGRLVCYVQP